MPGMLLTPQSQSTEAALSAGKADRLRCRAVALYGMGPHAQPLLPGHIIDQRSIVPRRELETALYWYSTYVFRRLCEHERANEVRKGFVGQVVVSDQLHLQAPRRRRRHADLEGLEEEYDNRTLS
ncbi:hypothetical protein DTO280E4_2152 [Paecilomyces variotii]|nr:hypothetical protein DTO280E4_2152 [Paecilomyces variotii]